MESKLTKSQFYKTEWKEYKEGGERYRIRANVRYDDQCGNGHNTFAITGETNHYRNGWREDSCGRIHDLIGKHFPELAPYIKWHLVSSDAPLHYAANAIYHASNRDCWGKLAGEPYNFERRLMFNGVPFLYEPKKELLAHIDAVGLHPDLWAGLSIVAVEYKPRKGENYNFNPHYTLDSMLDCDWYSAPFKSMDEAANFLHCMTHCEVEIVKRATAYGKGKERDFNAARAAAIWPEATDEQLSLPPEELRALIDARLPTLQNDFAAAMIALGFTF